MKAIDEDDNLDAWDTFLLVHVIVDDDEGYLIVG